MKSLIWVNQFAVLPSDGGGTRHFELGRELVRKGWSVTVLASDFHLHRRAYTRRSSVDDRRPVVETVDGVEFRWLWAAPYTTNNWRRLWNWTSFGQSLARDCRRLSRPDVVIGSSPQLLAARAAAHAARRWGTPFVFEVRDLWPESLVAAGGSRGLAYPVLDAIAGNLYGRADRVMVLSDGAGEYLRARVPEERIVCVPNGADIERPAGDPPPNDPSRPLTLVYAGAHGPANGLDRVLDAAERIGPDGGVRFLMVGDGPLRQALQDDAAARGLRHVTFMGSVPKAALSEVFASADAGLMILRDAPLFSFAVSPNKLFDYLAAGLLVIGNVPGEVAGMLTRSGAGFQAANSSAEALVDAIAQLQGTPYDERVMMRYAGRQWVEAEHGRPVLGRRLEAVLDSVMPGAHTG